MEAEAFVPTGTRQAEKTVQEGFLPGLSLAGMQLLLQLLRLSVPGASLGRKIGPKSPFHLTSEKSLANLKPFRPQAEVLHPRQDETRGRCEILRTCAARGKSLLLFRVEGRNGKGTGKEREGRKKGKKDMSTEGSEEN